MNTRFRRLSWLLGLALGVMLALLISPSTRWLVQAQVAACGLSFHTPAAQVRQADQARRQTVAAHPADLPVQIAAAVGGPNPQSVARLRALVPRFGDGPALDATLLRYEVSDSETRTGVYLSRAEDWALGSQRPPADVKNAPTPAPALLAAFDADAAAGERLDPDNAFFPLMRAAGLFAARRDAEAMAAVQRAGAENGWQEYISDEVSGRLRLADSAYGHGSGLSRIAVVASVLYPHYAPLRGVARVAIAKAIVAEQTGHTEQGLAIRRAVMHVGGLMRADSSAYIGSLVGIAITAIATARPGGAPALATTGTLTGEQRSQARLQAFCAYARRLGHPEDARRARAEAAAGEAARTVFEKAQDRSLFSTSQLARLGLWWGSDLLTLANAFWLAVLGAVAAGLSRLPSLRERRPLPRPALWGMTALLFTAALASLPVFAGAEAQDSVILLSALVIAPIVGLLIIRLLRASPTDRPVWRRNTGQFARAFLLTGLALAALGALAAWQARGVIGFAAAVRELTGQSGLSDGPPSGIPQAQETTVAAIFGSLALPLLMLPVLGVAGRARRVPVSVALTDGFRAGGVPLACVLLVVYGGLALGTVRQEREVNDGLRQMVQHEGRYYASLAGQAWPGVVP